MWYAKDAARHTLTSIGKPLNKYSRECEVSYRLTGPRFDYASWSSVSDEEVEGLIIE